MKRGLGLVLSLVVFAAMLSFAASPAIAGRSSLATITGSVKDNQGNPLRGALISLIKDGAIGVSKYARSGSDGRFSTRIQPGRYAIRAIADGFNAVAFASVEVRASQELVYRFNLEPIGSGKTLPEQRKDREDVRWILRSAQTRRSIFQAQEGEDEDIKAALGIENGSTETATATGIDGSEVATANHGRRATGVVESYFSSDPYGHAYLGLNFAVSTPTTDNVELVFAGQTGLGPNAPERIEAISRIRIGERHRLGLSVGGMRLNSLLPVGAIEDRPVGQFSVRAIDEWIVRDGIVIVLGLDYSRFIGAGGAASFTPRVGIQFDANARTRFTAAYVPGDGEAHAQSVAGFEGTQVVFTDSGSRPVAYIDGQAVMERSRRLEFGVERVIDNSSNVEATAFFDTTSGRGVGFLSTPLSAFSGPTGEALINVANQEGSSRGVRVVYTRRLSRHWTASAGYSFGQGQQLSAFEGLSPSEVFTNGFFQTGALQLGAVFDTGTHVRTVLRFSPDATVFAIDPFAGRLGVYDPSLSIQITQDLPNFGLPVRAEAVLDARNLLDAQAATENGEILTQLLSGRRSVRGGISVRF
ncbi:MAG: carboxypeptidase-like regulatory domain-containing protein [Pyrinomonadaceae bacterium]|nr:carboxypeptidase-like regulatory domain-containing protein [Pyrinomonadaceae bacterium]